MKTLFYTFLILLCIALFVLVIQTATAPHESCIVNDTVYISSETGLPDTLRSNTVYLFKNGDTIKLKTTIK